MSWLDQSASSAICGAVAFGCLIFSRLDYIEAFEMLGLKAKFREKLSEADAILESLKKTALTIAGVQISEITSRETSWKARKVESDKLTADLIALGVKPAVVRDITLPLLRAATNEMVTHAHHLILERNSVARKQDTTDGGDQRILRELGSKDYLSHRIDHPEYIERLRTMLAESLISAPDREKILAVINQIEQLTADMWTDMSFRDDVVEFLTRFDLDAGSREKSLYTHVFPDR